MFFYDLIHNRTHDSSSWDCIHQLISCQAQPEIIKNDIRKKIAFMMAKEITKKFL